MKTFQKSSLYPIAICFGLLFIISSCEKEEEAVFNVVNNDAQQMRKAYTDKGYTEVIVDSIVKIHLVILHSGIKLLRLQFLDYSNIMIQLITGLLLLILEMELVMSGQQKHGM